MGHDRLKSPMSQDGPNGDADSRQVTCADDDDASRGLITLPNSAQVEPANRTFYAGQIVKL